MERDLLKRTVLVLLAGLAATAAAGCGGDDLDKVVIGPDDPVEVRTLLSLTGASSLGESLRASVEMAVGDFGRIHGHEVELGVNLDSMCSPDGGRAGAERIAAEPQVFGVIGTSCSAAAVAASPVISAAGLVMIAPSNTSPVLTSDLRGNAGSDNHPGYFRVANNDLYQAQAVAGFVYDELGLRRMVTMHDGDPYTTALASAFEGAFTGRGGDVAHIGAIDKGQTDMADVLAEFAAVGPDGIFFPLFRTEGAHFIRQVREFGGLEDVTLISGTAALVAEFLALPQTEGIYFAGPPSHVGSNFNIATGRTADEALAAFEAGYGGLARITPYWAHAYDATTLLLSAIRRAAVPDDGNFFTRLIGAAERGTLRVSRSALREAVREVSNDRSLFYGAEEEGFPGLTGALSCDGFGDCAQGIQVIYHHTDASVTDPGELPVIYRVVP